MKIAAFVPAKGSSNRITSKNLRLLDGKPLFLKTLEKLEACDFIDEVYLDTESEDVIQLASECNVNILKRDKKLASNKTDGNQLLLNEIKQVKADIYVQVLCTSPFIKEETIKKAIDIVRKDRRHDSVTLVKREKLYTWNDNGKPDYDISNIPNSNTLDDTVIETMGLYVIGRKAALETGRRIGNKPFLLEASPIEAIDVNFPDDFELASLIAAGMRERDRKLLSNTKNLLNSSMLSDILEELGLNNQVIRELAPNIPDSKILGRAKTMKLRALGKSEDYRGIYKALDSYATVVPNDVIIVENELENFAYFGEINANLAIRQGACGAIIGGYTRDSKEVAGLSFPVFARGHTCQDVKKRATVDTINKKISIQGVSVSPNDLIFADNEGVIVIPRKAEQKIMKLVYETIAKEKSIVLDISLGRDTFDLTGDHGYF